MARISHTAVPYSRIMLDVVLLLSIFLFPFWVTILLGLYGLFTIPRYVELVIAALIVELLYHSSAQVSLFLFSFPFAALCALIAVEALRLFLRTRLRI